MTCTWVCGKRMGSKSALLARPCRQGGSPSPHAPASSGFLRTSRRGLSMSAWERRIQSEMRPFDGHGPRISIPTRPPLVGPLHLLHHPLSHVHSLAHPRSGAGDNSWAGGAGPAAPGGGSRGRRRSSGQVNHCEVPVSALSLAGSSGCDLGADGCLDAFWVAASLRVVRDAVPVHATASACGSFCFCWWR